MLGYAENEIGDSINEWVERVHPNDLPAVMEEVNRYMAGDSTAYASEHRLRCKDGTYKWALARGKAIEWGERHEPLRVIGTHKDITVRKQTEEKLRESREYYRALVETLDASLCRWLPDTTLTYANEKYKRIFGVQGDAVGQKWADFLPEETRESTIALYREVAEKPRAVTYEHPVNVEDGSTRQYLWTDTLLLDESGKVLEFQSIGIDITERKHAEEVLAKSEARTRELLEATPDAMIIVDAEGKILMTNAQTEAMFGYTQSELVGAAVETLMPLSLRGGHAENRAQFMAQPQTVTTGIEQDISAERKNGEKFPVEISLSHHKLAGGQVVVLCAIRDVTERWRARELITAQRDLARTIGAYKTDENSCESCLEIALRVSKMDSGGVYLFDERSRTFKLIHHQGMSAEFVGVVEQFGEDTPNAHLLLNGRTVYFTESDLQEKEYHRAEGLRSLAVIPIQHHGQALGCLNIASHIFPGVPAWSRSALETLAVEIGNIIIQRRTEESLKASRTQLSQALVAARMGTWRYHVPTARMDWSPEATGLFGFDASHNDFSTMLTRFHPDDRERLLHSIQEALVQKKVLVHLGVNKYLVRRPVLYLGKST
jgi:PAS domain S-box-containing protein